MGLSRDQRLAKLLAEFAHTLGTEFPVQKILDHLVLRIVDILPITGAGVMLVGENDELHFAAASNDVIRRIEVLQNELHQAPCLEAATTGLAVVVPDLAEDRRYPEFSRRALGDGLSAIFTFPIRLDQVRIGVLDLYRDTPGQLAESDLAAAQVLADVAAAYIANARARVEASATMAELSHRSLHDPLTGLPNRALLTELLEHAVARSRRSKWPVAVLFVDLDGFKSVNDCFGHQVGDELLVEVADRLRHTVRPGDTVARVGGDEFVVLCEDLRVTAQAETVASRLVAALAAPAMLATHRVALTASVGIAYSGLGSDLPERLLGDADYAMYQAKRDGGGRYQLMDADARILADINDDLERDLQQAQRLDQLALVYQPIVDVPTGMVSGAEALIRWHHPQRGLVMPDRIIPSAERSGLIQSLGEWALRQACRDLQKWDHHGLAVGRLAVNVSAHQVMQPGFAQIVERVLVESEVDPERLCLEITESVFLADALRALAVLREVKQLGVALSLDDFGTGYSSLRYLRHFPVDVVKIDRSFTADLPTDKATKAVVRAIIDLSHVLDLSVTAEGVQTPGQLSQIIDLGADHVQGFHISYPLASSELPDYVGDRRSIRWSVPGRENQPVA